MGNAFAAVAGSGPAYIYQVIEALADGGVMMGLPRDLANEHAAAMVQGAAAMVLQGATEGKHSAKLKDEVALPVVQPSGASRSWRREASGPPSCPLYRLQLRGTRSWAKSEEAQEPYFNKFIKSVILHEEILPFLFPNGLSL